MDEKHSEQLCDDVKKLMTILPEYIKRLEKTENKLELHERALTELSNSNAETKVYVKMILDKLDGLEGNMFGYVKQAMRDATAERKEERLLTFKERTKERELEHTEQEVQSNERVKMTISWQTLIKYVVGATIGASIGMWYKG
jgi:hypothetical protein